MISNFRNFQHDTSDIVTISVKAIVNLYTQAQVSKVMICINCRLVFESCHVILLIHVVEMLKEEAIDRRLSLAKSR